MKETVSYGNLKNLIDPPPPLSSDEGEEKEKSEEKNPDEPLKMDMSEEQMELQKKAKEYLKQKVNEGEKGQCLGLVLDNNLP